MSKPYFLNYTGAILTFLISLVRYVLALKSAKNIQPPNEKVLKMSIAAFVFLFTAISLYLVVSGLLDIPVAMVVEACAWREREPRVISKIKLIILQTPNYYNFGSIIVDLMMLRFLKKTLHPTSLNLNLIRMPSRQNENPNEISKFLHCTVQRKPINGIALVQSHSKLYFFIMSELVLGYIMIILSRCL
jgi:hypothetical protein